MPEDEKDVQLYRFEYWTYDEKRSAVSSHVMWETAESKEELMSRAEEWFTDEPVLRKEAREATPSESDAYMDGFTEGAMMAAAQAKSETYNGVAYVMTRSSAELSEEMSITDMFTKMFVCGACDQQFDFLDAAMAGNYFVCTTKETSALWHVCKGCA